METIYLGLVIFLLILAVIDLSVGVSNDAVNFLNSAIGSKAASFRTVLIVAGIGVFCGATMSNGMMDVARHGIFLPEYFYFDELMCVFLAVIVTDVVLLDIFNSLGMPTSTTVSLVFELLGGSTMMAMIKLSSHNSGATDMYQLINTEKALSVIIAIFVSVAIAFVVGTVVQFISRIVFTFNYKSNLKWKIGLFGGISTTAIIYFLLINGLKGMSFMTADKVEWINQHTGMIVGICFVAMTLLMQLLHLLKVNVFKVIVLLGTFSLAMAFAGNDLVNFIGVPLTGLDSYIHFINAGGGDPSVFGMGFLNESATTPIYILAIAGAVMVYSLATSKKAHNVIKTSVDLARQNVGDEMFGSSRVARSLVRKTTALSNNISEIIPPRVRAWIDSRFNQTDIEMESGAAFDLVRASVNLVLAGLLVALGTSLKLPLSTTYVTFMVAMGSSLADRAWGRESAVFRITGVISVIGGWFLTAGAAFISCAIVLLLMYYGGIVLQVGLVTVAITILVRSNIRYRKKVQKENEDVLFSRMVVSKDKAEIWDLLCKHVAGSLVEFVDYTKEEYSNITNAFINEDLKSLRRSDMSLRTRKSLIKKVRRKEMIGLQRVDKGIAIEKNTWFHLGINSCLEIYYCLRRICEPCEEHVDNNFEPLPKECIKEFIPLRDTLVYLLEQTSDAIKSGNYEYAQDIRMEGDKLKESFSVIRKIQMNRMQDEDTNLAVSYVYLNMLQESQEIVASLRHLLRAANRFKD